MLRHNPKLLAKFETSVVQQFHGYVVNLAAKRKYDLEWTEHMVQSGLILVWKAYNKWNPERAGFYTWITYYVNILMNRAFFEDIIAPNEKNISWNFYRDDAHGDERIDNEELNHGELPQAIIFENDQFSVTNLHLCERDAEIAAMLAEGYTKKEIKNKLDISSDALKMAIENIRYSYLQYKNTERVTR